MHVTSKREKLQYAYVFITDLLTLTVSIVLAWLITDGLLNVIVPYEPRDWMQTISLVFLSFVATFFCFDQDENIVTRSLGREFRLSVKFNILLGLVYSAFMLLTLAEMMGAHSGLGYFIRNFADYANYTNVLAGILLVALVITLLNRAVTALETRLVRWH